MDASIVITVVVIIGTLAITVASLLGAKKMISGMLSPLLAQQAETKRLLTVGIPCAARVLHVDQTGTSVAVMGEQSYELRFQLEVTPLAAGAYRGGAGPYHAQMVSLVPMLALSRVQPGSVITVRCDPHDPMKLVFESANPPGLAPPMPGAYTPAGPMGGHGAQAPMGGYGAPTPSYGQYGQYGQPQTPAMPGQPPPGYGGHGPGPHGGPGGWNVR